MRLLHTMLRVGNLDKSIDFYTNVLGMRVLRRNDYPDGKFTLAFVGYQDEAEGAVIELTHNWDTDKYDLGSGYGHIALEVDNAYEACDKVKERGGKVTREAGPMKHGTTVIAFVEDPTATKLNSSRRRVDPEALRASPGARQTGKAGSAPPAAPRLLHARGMCLIDKQSRRHHDSHHPQNGRPSAAARGRAVAHFGTPELRALVADMFETMAAARGVGLAAPQIGVDLQLVIFGFDRNERYPDAPAVPQTILCNPVITPLSDEMEDGWEGCLSVPGLRGLVPRYRHIRYTGLDPQGQPIEREAEGFHARVVQHECDHLIGRLYPSRIQDFSKFGYTEILFPGMDPNQDD